jgi:hypothetical protein
MIKIQDVVRNIVESDEEALYSLSKGFMNLSAYAKSIRKEVEDRSFKKVNKAGIVVALSRIKKELKGVHPMIKEVKIIKSPLSEIVFEKTPALLSQLSLLYSKVKTGNDDFLTMTLSTKEITVICSDRIKELVLEYLKEKPILTEQGLASIGLSLDPKYYPMPNITFSLIRKIARKEIPLAETITTHTEIIFVFHQKDMSEMVELFKTTV